jgi:hypothetical protein
MDIAFLLLLRAAFTVSGPVFPISMGCTLEAVLPDPLKKVG